MTLERAALELAVAEHADRQHGISPDVWDVLIGRGLVRRVRDDGDPPREWLELTELGCAALELSGGEIRSLDTCWSCGKSSPQLLSVALPDCPKCGAYAGDE